jgi:hypothetical protein
MGETITPDGEDENDSPADKIRRLEGHLEAESEMLDGLISDSLFGDSSNPFHPEYSRDYPVTAKVQTISPWDILIAPKERRRIEALKPKLNAEFTCPYLRRPHDPTSKAFFYCSPKAIACAGPRSFLIGHPSRKPTQGGEENFTRCNLGDLVGLCLTRFSHCTVYQAEVRGESKDLCD